jgi:hypothetical protein
LALFLGALAVSADCAKKQPAATAKLTASDGAPYDWFGFSVGIGPNALVVGASGWVTTSKFQAKLTGADGSGQDYFGSSVSISGNTVTVGSDGWPGGSQQGVAYVFTALR